MLKKNGKEYINPEISRRILRAAKCDGNKYQSWMRNYITPKDFYKIIKLSLHNSNLKELSSIFVSAFNNKGIYISISDFYSLLQKTNKLSLILLFLNSLLPNTLDLSNRVDQKLLYLIFQLRINNSKSLTNYFQKNFNLYERYNNFLIIAPVCPDYSYDITNEGKYKYTFKGVGNGIGVVANKAIQNIKLLKNLCSDLVENGFLIEFKTLLGDFEANEQNLLALNETQDNFLKKINQSAFSIYKNHSIISNNFTSICNGLKGWNNQISYIKNFCKINNYEDLKIFAPDINHDKNLISRLPLYKKWFGSDKDFKRIFFNQSLEYMAMGYLMKNYYGDKCILLASDHKAMRPYYTILANINLIASSANY